jgi:hypothetical protein
MWQVCTSPKVEVELSSKAWKMTPADILPPGLSNAEARRRLADIGPNTTPDTHVDPLRMVLGRFVGLRRGSNRQRRFRGDRRFDSTVAGGGQCRRGAGGAGIQVLGVAAAPPAKLQLAGLMSLSDPPSRAAAACIAALQSMGGGAIIVTGDARDTPPWWRGQSDLRERSIRPGRLPIRFAPRKAFFPRLRRRYAISGIQF